MTYIFSAYLFSQIYLWSVPEDAGLSWITYYSGDRPRLNEKPIFFTTHLVVLGLEQAIFHLLKDYDRLALGFVKPESGNGKGNGDGASQIKQFRDKMPDLLQESLFHSFVGLAISLAGYPLFFRHLVWRTTLMLFRPFYSLPKTNIPPSVYPITLWVLIRCVLAGFLAVFIWSAGNAAFSIFLVKEPLKNGKPLTSESKDPNGSLLNGLKSKKLSIKVWFLSPMSRCVRDMMLTRSRASPSGSWRSSLVTTRTGGSSYTRISTARTGLCGLKFSRSASIL